jgi:hypothetical protein
MLALIGVSVFPTGSLHLAADLKKLVEQLAKSRRKILWLIVYGFCETPASVSR